MGVHLSSALATSLQSTIRRSATFATPIRIRFCACHPTRNELLDRYEPHDAGGRDLIEYWIPADELVEFNANIVGEIELIHGIPTRSVENKFFKVNARP